MLVPDDAAEAKQRNVVALTVFRRQLWAACYGQGLYFLDGKQWRFQQRCPKYITDLCADVDRLWFCTWMEGEIGFVKRVYAPPIKIPLPRLVNPRFTYRNFCIAASETEVWVGSQTYLLRLQKGSREETPEWDLVIPSDIVYSIVPHANGIWIATAGGVWVFKENSQGFLFQSVRSDMSISRIALDSDGKALWVGSKSGKEGALWLYEIEKGRWNLVVKFSIRDNEAEITAILPSKRFVYVAIGSCEFTVETATPVKGGVGMYDKKNGQWYWLEGLQGKDIKSLAVFEGNLWVGGADGIQIAANHVE
jgi:ligand-binding sensor domain-containing protein